MQLVRLNICRVDGPLFRRQQRKLICTARAVSAVPSGSRISVLGVPPSCVDEVRCLVDGADISLTRSQLLQTASCLDGVQLVA